MNEQIDFVAIGDITTDAFIQLSTEHTHIIKGRKDKKQMCMNFGDKIPYESVEVVRSVGNGPNAGVSASRLGLRSASLTNLGDDTNGKECIEALKADNVITDYVKVHANRLTNYHYVLRYEEERTILVKHEEYDYVLPDLAEPKWIYLTSLASNSLEHHHEIAKYLQAHPNTKLAFQPGTFQMKLGYEKLKEVYNVSELFFCNVEEAQRILNNDEEDIKKLLASVLELGPKIAVITDGPLGAYTYNGHEFWHMPMYPDPAPPVDRTGAGDSFASTFTSALALGKTIPEALSWGPINSMSVVQHIGAQKGLLTRDKLEEYLTNRPPEYVAKQI